MQLEFRKYLYKFSFYWRKTGFREPFWIFTTKPEVNFLTQYFLRITTIEPENLPFEFWKYIYKFSFYWRKTGFRQPFWIFTTKPEVNFWPNIFYESLPSNLKICHSNFENISTSSRFIDEKPVFGSHFEFLRPNRK